MSEHSVSLRGGYAALDADQDYVHGHGWHFFDDEGVHLFTLPYAAWGRDALQRAFDAVTERADDLYDRGYDAGRMHTEHA